MTTKLERGLKNSAQITCGDVLSIMFTDGFGPYEALDHVAAYAREITGLASPTACLRVQACINSIARGAA